MDGSGHESGLRTAFDVGVPEGGLASGGDDVGMGQHRSSWPTGRSSRVQQNSKIAICAQRLRLDRARRALKDLVEEQQLLVAAENTAADQPPQPAGAR